MSEIYPDHRELYPEIRELSQGGIVVVRALLLNPENYEQMLLLHRRERPDRQGRPDRHTINDGLWEQPGGKLWPDDNDVFAGGIREIEIACGYEVRFETNALSRIHRYKMSGGARDGFMYTGLSGFAKVIGGDLSLGARDDAGELVHDDVAWVQTNLWIDKVAIPEDLQLTAQAEITADMYNECTLGVEHLIKNSEIV